MLDPRESGEINKAADSLKYRDHITVILVVKKTNLFPDQWIYIHSADVRTARVANFNNFSKAMAGEGDKTVVSVEYFTYRDEALWLESDESLAQLAIGELTRMGMLEANEVEEERVVRETEAYPVYDMGFQEHHDLLRSRIDRFSNFYSIGRAGMHRYNNMDHSLMNGILAARNYLKTPGSPYALWDINMDAEYLEGGRR